MSELDATADVVCGCDRSAERSVPVGMVVLGAGSGERLGAGVKAFVDVGGKPMLTRTLEAVLGSDAVGAVVVVVPAQDLGRASELVREVDDGRISAVVSGGNTRQDSTRAGLAALGDAFPFVAIGEVARPLLPSDLIDRLVTSFRSAEAQGLLGVVPAVPLFDTIRTVGVGGRSAGTVPRNTLRSTQTPQLFCRHCLAGVVRRCVREGIVGTDDAELVEQCGGRVMLAAGAAENFKITVAADLILAESLLAARGAFAG